MPRKNPPTKHARYKPSQSCQDKTGYKTQHDAENIAEIQMLKDMKLTLQVYRCDLCKKWHLTSVKDDQSHA